jgi:hypothetical protein
MDIWTHRLCRQTNRLGNCNICVKQKILFIHEMRQNFGQWQWLKVKVKILNIAVTYKRQSD